MIFGAVILFFLMGVVAIYALIQTGKNYALQAVLIPVILVGTLFAGYAIYILQGTPKQGIPEYDVEVVFVQMQKPHILFLAREAASDDASETDPIPKYFVIPYNDQNKKTMNKIMKRMEMGQPVEGKFKKKDVNPNGNQPPTGEFEFDNIIREGLPPKAVREDDVSYNPDDFEGVDSNIQNRLMERGDYDVLGGTSTYPGTSAIEDPYEVDPKELEERTGENVNTKSVVRKKYTQEELESFTDSFVDPKYDYYEAF